MVKSRRVLVVDDDAVVGHSINRVLSEQGYQVRETLNGAEALVELEHQSYDLVFTDIKMPGIDGLDMTARLRQSHPEMPVVVITGYGTEANEQKARKLGVSAFLRKPLSPEMIVDNAERLMREANETSEAIRRSALGLLQPTAAKVEPTAAAVPSAAAAMRQPASVAKNLALFFAAPFIGLVYIVAFPFVGVWAIGKYGYKALAAKISP